MKPETLRTLLDTIDELDGTLDVLNLSNDSLLCQQQDNLPYGAIHNALMVCIDNLLAVPGEDFRMPNDLKMSAYYRELLFDLSAIGALRQLVEELAVLADDTAEAYSRAFAEKAHEDELDDLRREKNFCFKIYTTIRDLAAAAA